MRTRHEEHVIRICLDGTPLLGQPTGVGRYVRQLVRGLASTEDRVSVTAFTVRGASALPGQVPEDVEVRSRAVPARLLRQLWARVDWPPVSALAGPLDVFHATNFVLPPTGRYGGVLTVHDLAYLHHRDTVDRTSLAYRDLVPRGIARAGQVVVPSAAVAAEITEAYRLAPDRITVTHLGVDATWFDAVPLPAIDRARIDLPSDYLLAVGTIEPRKGLPRLLAAYREVRAAMSETPPLVLVGPAGWGRRLELERLPAGSVRLTGFLPDDLLRGVVAGARALLFPSRYEGFGLPPVEALACGVPVVASDIPVTREVLGAAARLTVSDTDLTAAVSEAVVGTLPGTTASRREHARRYSWASCVLRTREAYSRALS